MSDKHQKIFRYFKARRQDSIKIQINFYSGMVENDGRNTAGICTKVQRIRIKV